MSTSGGSRRAGGWCSARCAPAGGGADPRAARPRRDGGPPALPAALLHGVRRVLRRAGGGRAPGRARLPDWRGRLVTHDHVDVGTLIEIAGPDGPLPLAHLVRDADVRSVADVSDELRAVRAAPAAAAAGAS